MTRELKLCRLGLHHCRVPTPLHHHPPPGHDEGSRCPLIPHPRHCRNPRPAGLFRFQDKERADTSPTTAGNLLADATATDTPPVFFLPPQPKPKTPFSPILISPLAHPSHSLVFVFGRLTHSNSHSLHSKTAGTLIDWAPQYSHPRCPAVLGCLAKPRCRAGLSLILI
ncbi:hypothetical protein CGRA01v4_03391 [Colletotrichum graminicola]|nr:hypothetical protein CGRA01v4_03391 [Colletotrichum graminicola]